ncbi:MAG: hypothetical protein LUG27_01975 [Clostridiales bacterium]|nr:hypothetical protein [Clostridiales bacterium]
MGKIIDQWNGQVEDAKIEYDYERKKIISDVGSDVRITTDFPDVDYDKADKADYIVAASCGVLTGLLDSFWGGEFSLSTAQEWGRSKANSFVIKVAQMRGYGKSELDGAIRFLEKDAPIPSDQLTRTWGGGLQHHFRDFAHHASVVGLVFSVMSQFTGLSYGTNTEGRFEMHELSSKDLIGKTFEEKLFNGTVIWVLHLVSDMAGSSSNAGKGTGIPGPILSLAKELSVLPKIRDLKMEYKGNEINLSVMLSKIFNGTAFSHSGHDDVVRFDLRTEMGIYAFGVAQSIPVVINQCMVRAFYFVKRLYIEISRKQIKGIRDIAKLEPEHFLPWNNKCIVRMLTISSGVFCSVDVSDAAIRSFIRSPQNKSEFFSQFLLRMNFVGIGNFVVSIKNDIAANIFSDSKGLSNIDKGTNSDNSIPENITIDIAVEIDNTRIYDYAFYRMYGHVKETKENFTAAYNVNVGMERRILRLEDDETDLFNCVASASQHALIVETEELMMRLFTLYGVDYIAFAGDSKYKFHMPFYRNESRGRIGYIFSRSLMERIKWETIKEEYNIDGINVVALVELGENSETRNAIMGEETRRSQGFVQYMPLRDLFALISDDEYDVYMNYVNKFNKDIYKLIGYRTIVVPSDSSLKTLKADIENELRTADFDSQLIHEGVYNNQLQVIRNNFWERGLYQALLSDCSFAESFISSEWYYKTHVEFSVLEQTAIIAGYLKSVEQLLYAIVQLSEGTGKQIKKKGGERVLYIDFTAENEPFIDSTLGSIISYVRHYSDLWEVNAFVKNFVVNKLNVYREKYRNDHFHKDNVNSIEEIEEIRENTILLHYLLLGAMRIKDADKKKLGIVNIPEIVAEEKKDISYGIFEEWLNRIIGGDVLLPKTSKIYFQIGGWGTDKWKLEFSTVSGFNDQGFPKNIKWPYIGDDLKWDRVLEEDAMEKKVISFIEEYLQNGKYAGNLKAYKMISAGWLGCPQILYKQ